VVVGNGDDQVEDAGPVAEGDLVDLAEEVAALFHDTYEQLAPRFDYQTRRRSAVPWEQVPENNRRLMVATVRVVLSRLGLGEVVDVDDVAPGG